MPDVAQRQVDVVVIRFGAVDQEAQLHQDFADPALDVGQVDVFGGDVCKQRGEAGTDAVVHVGGDLLPFRDGGIDDFELGLLAELLQPVDENRGRDHRRGEYEPAQPEQVERSQILRAKIVAVVRDRHVERRSFRSHERADPRDPIKRAAAVKGAFLFYRDHPVVDDRDLEDGRAVADLAVQGAYAYDAVLAGQARQSAVAQLEFFIEPDEMRQPV